MVQSTDIKVLNIDGTPYAVDDMSEEVKGLVKVWNGWSEKENELSDSLTMVRAAKETLSRQIISTVRKEKADAEAAAAEAAPQTTTAPGDEQSLDPEPISEEPAANEES